jgi:hypothetical protein
MRAPVSAFSTVTTTGGLLPPDLLDQIGVGRIDGLTPADFGLAKGERLNEATSRAWERVKSYWAAFSAARESLTDAETGVSETREQWLLPLFRELGYGRLTFHPAAEEVAGRRYAISHRAGEERLAPPVNLVSFRTDLDRLTGSAGQARTSPHGSMQEFLNRTDHQWGIVSNGLKLRLLRDNLSLSRAAYVEFDLATMLDGGVYSDFALLYLLVHRTRLPLVVEGDLDDSCWLERWRNQAEAAGKRSLDNARVGVETALRALGQGLLEHPANDDLRRKLQTGELSIQGYYRQLLRLVYRFLFLFAAEDRELLFDKHARPERRAIYEKHYGVSRLRELVEQRRRFDRHDDLWRSLHLTFRMLVEPDLGAKLDLKPLAGGLFGAASCPDLDAGQIVNTRLLEAIAGLAHTPGEGRAGLRRTNYRDMDVEELGSVYESLLDLQPELVSAIERPRFELGRSGERKSTGSYYTNPGLVRELIVSALEPVIAEPSRAAPPPPNSASICWR